MQTKTIGRRGFLAGTFSAGLFKPGSARAVESGWEKVPAILSRIAVPRFPAREFPITKFGAKGDGTTDCSAALRGAIDACSRAGGGTVRVPSGRFLTGPLHLKSNVHLRLDQGSTLVFSSERSKYLPVVFTRFEGTECMNWSPMIYAFEQENIAITGSGTLDGQGSAWREMNKESGADRKRLLQLAAEGVPVQQRVFGEGHNLRPNFIQLYRCRNLWLEGITLKNSPMWTVHLVLSRNITARNITIESMGPNNDGIDPESCSDVLIEDCRFHTQDDGIAIKSGRNHDGRRINVPSENIVIRNCLFENIHRNLFAIGSEVSGGVRNVFMEKCKLSHGLRGLYIKSNIARGGVVENLYFRDLEFEDVKEAFIRIGMDYGNEKGNLPPVFRNFHFENLRGKRAKLAVEIVGLPQSPVEQVSFSKCAFEEVTGPNRIEHARGLRIE